MKRCIVSGLVALFWGLGAASVTGLMPGEQSFELDPGRSDLRPLGWVTPEEHTALSSALAEFSARVERDDFAALERFLQDFPKGAWAPAVRLRLAEEYYDTGWYSKALRTHEALWAERGQNPAPEASVFSTHVGVGLLELYARLGRLEDVAALMGQFEQATLWRDDVETLRGVQQGMATMKRHPEVSFRCGALALERVRVYLQTTNAGHEAILNSRSSAQGMSLSEVAGLSATMGMDYQMAFRPAGAALVTPAVAHLKLGHFVALLREHRGKAQIEDPTGWQSVFASRAALDSELSGYFLVPPGRLPPGWRPVTVSEGEAVWGRNGVLDNDPDGSGKRDRKVRCGGGQGGSSFGMATWDVHLMLVSQQIIDTPLRYEPPVGPPVEVTFRHTQRANRRFGYRPYWTHNWVGQVYENPRAPLGDLWLHEEGGWERFSPLDEEGKTYRGRVFNVGRQVRQDAKTLLWQFPDGTTRTYSTFSDANVSWGRVFYLSGVADAAGNQVKIGLLPSGRVESVTDAIGQVTRFYYDLTDPGLPSVPGQPVTSNWEYTNQVTRVVDPFGRSTQLEYAKVVRTITGICSDQGGTYYCPFYYHHYDLTNITDMGGLSSQFAYDYSGLVVTNLTTPYGSTRFEWKSRAEGDYGIEITDPEGNTERIEYMPYGSGGIDPALWKRPQGMRTDGWGALVAHWDKQAYAQSLRDGSLQGATIYMFQLSETLASAGRVLMAVKKPLENPVWYNYPGQGSPLLPGIGDQPTLAGRVLDDGSTQLSGTERDQWSNLVKNVDPLGRTTRYVYAANQVDLLEVRQLVGNQEEVLLRATWNERHDPLTVTDASGSTTRFSYNSRGQLTGFTNALNEITTVTYDAKGFVTATDGPLPGTQDRDTFTYDTFGRVRTVTDADGYAITIDYDLLDRLTRLTFPDGTFQEFAYDRMDVGTARDRLGRETRYSRDGLGRITAMQDAMGRITRLQWCGCGSLAALIDPMGRMTQWHRDLQGRIIAKEFADGSRIVYEYERATSRLWRRRDGQNQVTEFRYDLSGALVSQTYLNAQRPTPNVLFTYDPYYPRPTSMADGEGVTSYGYQAVNGKPGAGLLSSIDGPWANDSVSITYDALGRVLSRAVNGVAMRRAYDAAGRLSGLTNALGQFNFAFDGASDRLSGVTYPNGQRSEFEYGGNLRDQLVQRVSHFLPGGAKLSEFTYSHNPLGLVTNWTQFQAGRLKTWSLAYDPVRRLTNALETISPVPPVSTAWTYDASDNRILEQTSGNRRDFYYNALNQLTGLTPPPSVPSVYEWDAENRLAGLSNATTRIEFGYDGLDRRTRITVKNGGTITSDRRYLWCGSQLCEERDASGANVLKRYSSYGVQNIAAPELPAGSYFFTRDHLGSVREMTSTAGISSVFDYSAYGDQTQMAGSSRPDFGFTGLFQPPGSGLWLAYYRAYSPSLGQWLSRDPGGESRGLNLHAYVEADPINYFDPDGFEGTAAGKLYSNTQGYKDAKAGTDAYNSAKKVGKLMDEISDKGAKEAIKGKLEDEAMEAKPKNPMEEYKQTMEGVVEPGKEGVERFRNPLKDAAKGINDNLEGKCQPSKPKRPKEIVKKKVEQKEKGLWDTFLDAMGFGDPPPPPPEPDGPIKIKPNPALQHFNPSAGY